MEELTELELDVIWIALREYSRRHRTSDAAEAKRADEISGKVYAAKKAAKK